MGVVNTLEATKELLALAAEIAAEEGLAEKDALRKAIAELPRLANDASQNLRYRPGQPRRRESLADWRYRPVEPRHVVSSRTREDHGHEQ